jgi:hypothetical protein
LGEIPIKHSTAICEALKPSEKKVNFTTYPYITALLKPIALPERLPVYDQDCPILFLPLVITGADCNDRVCAA